jgi:hypothetical protein
LPELRVILFVIPVNPAQKSRANENDDFRNSTHRVIALVSCANPPAATGKLRLLRNGFA